MSRRVAIVAPHPVGCAPAFGSGAPRLLCNTCVDVTSLRCLAARG
ncbi:hypothetical protein ACX6XY_15355 [Streptomyces sp. O3]